ncbi:hypothetical protein E2562_017975 [Oryza meyeriana var. granulata]|uniref:Uncharacterized protein n=1 Tax=Oryza meyeriana var. granulata TaxID=110450 RepID=A0A6G1F927_9ORYZ|nr:hypothetical protein E2562_017975 [Oryza meyeriana var. granulata]
MVREPTHSTGHAGRYTGPTNTSASPAANYQLLPPPLQDQLDELDRLLQIDDHDDSAAGAARKPMDYATGAPAPIVIEDGDGNAAGAGEVVSQSQGG